MDSNNNHVVDWQIVRTVDAAAHRSGDCNMREMRERLKALVALSREQRALIEKLNFSTDEYQD